MSDLRILDRAEIVVERARILAQLHRLDEFAMTVSPDQMLAKAERGEWQLWAAGDIEAVAATSLRETANGSVRLLWEGCAGDGQDWPALARRIERWAVKRGAVRARLHGRAGWVRSLGYQPIAVVAERTIDGQR